MSDLFLGSFAGMAMTLGKVRSIPLALLVLLSVVLFLLANRSSFDFVTTEHDRFASPDQAASQKPIDFIAQGPDGRFQLSHLRGRVVLIYFGYTACPDVCPTNLALLSLALRNLDAEEQNKIQGLFVTVDPARDRLERLDVYTSYFSSSIVGLTGTEDEIAAAARIFGVTYRASAELDTAADYAVDHTALTYIIDSRGFLVGSLPHASSAEDIVTAVREHL